MSRPVLFFVCLFGRLLGRLPLRYLSLGAFIIATAAACAGPCEQLANVVCNCEEDALQRQSCVTQVTNDVGRIKFLDADNAYCQEKLKTCDKDCVALRAGDRAACGFQKE